MIGAKLRLNIDLMIKYFIITLISKRYNDQFIIINPTVLAHSGKLTGKDAFTFIKLLHRFICLNHCCFVGRGSEC